MDYRSDRLSLPPDAFHPSSSSAFARRRWSQLTPSHSSPVVEPVSPSQQANPCRYESTLDESARSYRTTALRQLNGNPKPLSWKSRHANHSGSRSSSLASKPVLVRAYPGPDATTTPSKMPTRRSFPFAGSSRPQHRGPQLPSDEDFSIDGILRAIEPNIRSTLDSIGEICGRSKLSLANEYGSHIAPLGEIRASPGNLLTVEEASSDYERQIDENNVVIYDDDTSLMDGRDHAPFSHFGYFEFSRQPPTTAHNGGFHPIVPVAGGDGPSVQAQPDTPRSMNFNRALDADSPLVPRSAMREFASKPKSCGRALLGKKAESDTNQMQGILTPALVSEVLLDAQADAVPPPKPRDNGPVGTDTTRNTLNSPRESDKVFLLGDVQALFGWLTTARDQPEQTAEMRLRAMLERQNDPSPVEV